MTSLKSLCAVFIGLTSVGCGQQDVTPSGAAATTTSTTEQSKTADTPTSDWSLMVANTASLPPCDADGEGRLAYVKADAAFMTCSTGAWQKVELQHGTNPVNAVSKDGLIAVSAEPIGPNCKTGGKKIITGADSDNDGILSNSEIKSTHYLCAEQPGLRIKKTWVYYDNNIEASDPDLSSKNLLITTKVGEIQLTQFEDGSAFLSLFCTLETIDNGWDKYFHSFTESFFIPKQSGSRTFDKKLFNFSYYLRHTLNLDTEPPQLSLGLGNLPANLPVMRDFVLTAAP